MSQDLQAFLRARAHLGELAWGPGLALSAALHLAVAVPFFWPRAQAADKHQLWNAARAAEYLGVSTSWVYHRSAEGSIPCVRVGHALRFDPAALAAWTRGERRGGRVVPLK